MKFIRWFLGKLILFYDRTFAPRPALRSNEEQNKVDALAREMMLYQFQACPFCVKVRRAMRRMSIPVELRDAKKDSRYAKELVAGGGKLQVPCLRVREATGDRWIYESTDIIQYLESRIQTLTSFFEG